MRCVICGRVISDTWPEQHYKAAHPGETCPIRRGFSAPLPVGEREADRYQYGQVTGSMRARIGKADKARPGVARGKGRGTAR